jgi:WD40 repeat protein
MPSRTFSAASWRTPPQRGYVLASGTDLVWDASAGRVITGLTGHADTVWSLAFNPDGKTLVTGSPDRTARLWDVNPDPEQAIQIICKAVRRSMTRQEWAQRLPHDQPYHRTCPT